MERHLASGLGRHWFRQALSDKDLMQLHSLCEIGASSTRDLPLGDLKALIKGMAFFEAIKKAEPNLKIVRTVFFNKHVSHNWALPWHQDRVLRVKEHHESTGFTNWSRKLGQWHCEAPEDILSNMSFLHLYLDDVAQDEGPMEIALGSHEYGVKSADKVIGLIPLHERELCCAKAGDVLRVPMLIMHRSLAAERPTSRRVIRIDLAEGNLPQPLSWDT